MGLLSLFLFQIIVYGKVTKVTDFFMWIFYSVILLNLLIRSNNSLTEFLEAPLQSYGATITHVVCH